MTWSLACAESHSSLSLLQVQDIVREYSHRFCRDLVRPLQLARIMVALYPSVGDVVSISAHLGAVLGCWRRVFGRVKPYTEKDGAMPMVHAKADGLLGDGSIGVEVVVVGTAREGNTPDANCCCVGPWC